MAYLGETPIDWKKEGPYQRFTKEDWALLVIFKYGQIDGEHHKQWVIDQVARILNGCDIKVVLAKWDDYEPEYRFTTAEGESLEAYNDWVRIYQGAIDEDGNTEYGYDVGCPP